MAVNINESGSLKNLGGLQIFWEQYRKPNDKTPSFAATLKFSTTAAQQWVSQTIDFGFSPIWVVIMPIAPATNNWGYGYVKLTQTNRSFEPTISTFANPNFDSELAGAKYEMTSSGLKIDYKSGNNISTAHDTYLTSSVVAIG